MSFWKIAGDFAKGFAKGYVEERGLKGTLEDLGDLAKGAKNLMNGNDSDSEDAFFKTFDDLMDNKEYAAAEEFVVSNYGSKDDVYYYLIAKTKYFGSEADDEDQLREALTAVKKAYSGDRSWDKTVKELEDWIEEGIHEAAELNHWSEMQDQLTSLKDNHAFDEAEKILRLHYKDYANNKFDYYYWKDLFYIELEAQLIGSHQYDRKRLEQYIASAKALVESDKERENLSEMESSLSQLQESVSSKTEQASSKSSNDGEQEYLEEVKACYADDGVISDRERRILDKLRKSLGISEQRAAELESQVNPSKLSETEQEYADEVKACLEDDGIITDRERRILDRLRKSLGISEQRAMEIEKLLK